MHPRSGTFFHCISHGIFQKAIVIPKKSPGSCQGIYLDFHIVYIRDQNGLSQKETSYRTDLYIFRTSFQGNNLNKKLNYSYKESLQQSYFYQKLQEYWFLFIRITERNLRRNQRSFLTQEVPYLLQETYLFVTLRYHFRKKRLTHIEARQVPGAIIGSHGLRRIYWVTLSITLDEIQELTQ